MLFDTYEVIEGTDLSKWLLEELIPKLHSSLPIAIAGRNKIFPIKSKIAIPIKVDKFDLEETKALIIKRYTDTGAELDLTEIQIEKIYQLTEGRPILVNLSIDWLLENAKIDELIEENITENDFSEKLVSWIRNLDSELEITIIYMAIINRRFNYEILSYLRKLSASESKRILQQLSRFSFIKYRALSQSYQLHDEMGEMVQAIGYQGRLRNDIIEDVIKCYHQLISNATSLQEKQTYSIEQLYYQLLIDVEEGLRSFSYLFEQALDLGQLDYCKVLLDQVEKKSVQNAPSRDIINISRAELEIELFELNNATEILEMLVSKYEQLGTKGNSFKARCFVDLSKIHKFQGEYQHAIKKLEDSLKIYKEIGNREQINRVLLETGEIYYLMAQYGKAQTQLEMISPQQVKR